MFLTLNDRYLSYTALHCLFVLPQAVFTERYEPESLSKIYIIYTSLHVKFVSQHLLFIAASRFGHKMWQSSESYKHNIRMQHTRVGTLIVVTIYLQLIQNRYMFRSFTVLQCSHQHCVQPVASNVEVVGYL